MRQELPQPEQVVGHSASACPLTVPDASGSGEDWAPPKSPWSSLAETIRRLLVCPTGRVRGAYGAAEGQAVDIEIQAKEFVRNRELMNGIIASHTGQPLERVSKDTDRDFILTAEQAVEYGAVDEVITSRKIRPLLAATPAEGT
jgi:Clp protease